MTHFRAVRIELHKQHCFETCILRLFVALNLNDRIRRFIAVNFRISGTRPALGIPNRAEPQLPEKTYRRTRSIAIVRRVATAILYNSDGQQTCPAGIMKCSAVGISTEGTGASTPFVSSMYSSRSSSQSSSMPEVSASRETTTTTAPLDLLAAAAATVAAEFSCFPAPTRPLEEDAHRPWNSSSGTTAAASNSRHSHHPTALLALSNNTAYTIFPPSFTTTNSISPSTVVTDISNMRPMDCWNPAIQTNRIGNHQHYHYYTLSLPALQYHPHHHPRHNHNQARQQQQQQHSNNKTNCKEKQPYLCYRDAARKEKAEANAVAKLNEEAKAHDEAKSQAKAKNINEEAKEKALLKELSFLYRPYSAALRESSVCGSSASLSSSSAARTNYKKRKLNDISPLAYHGGGGTALEALEQSQYRKVTRLNREADHLQGFPPPPTTITDINQEAIPPIDEGSRAARGALVEATKQHWTRREDDIFVKFVQSCGELGGTNNNRYWTDKRYWNHLAQLLPGREAQHCRTRWAQHLDPSIVKGNWTLTEDLIILTTIESHGFKWVRMSQRMPGR